MSETPCCQITAKGAARVIYVHGGFDRLVSQLVPVVVALLLAHAVGSVHGPLHW